MALRTNAKENPWLRHFNANTSSLYGMGYLSGSTEIGIRMIMGAHGMESLTERFEDAGERYIGCLVITGMDAGFQRPRMAIRRRVGGKSYLTESQAVYGSTGSPRTA